MMQNSLSVRIRWLSLAAAFFAIVLFALALAALVEEFNSNEKSNSASYSCSYNGNNNRQCSTANYVLFLYIVYLITLPLVSITTLSACLNVHNYRNTPTYVVLAVVVVNFLLSWSEYWVFLGEEGWYLPHTKLQWAPFILFCITSLLIAAAAIVGICCCFYGMFVGTCAMFSRATCKGMCPSSNNEVELSVR